MNKVALAFTFYVVVCCTCPEGCVEAGTEFCLCDPALTQDILCPGDKRNCIFECDTFGACADLTFHCKTEYTGPPTSATACTLECSGQNSCENVKFFGESLLQRTAFVFECKDGFNSCLGAELYCGSEASCVFDCEENSRNCNEASLFCLPGAQLCEADCTDRTVPDTCVNGGVYYYDTVILFCRGNQTMCPEVYNYVPLTTLASPSPTPTPPQNQESTAETTTEEQKDEKDAAARLLIAIWLLLQ